MEKAPCVRLFNCRVDRVTMDDAMDRCRAFVEEGGPHTVVTADTSGIVIAQSDPEYMRILNAADLVTPDSIGVVWASRKFRAPVPERVPGVDTMEGLCRVAAQTGWRVFLFGAAPGVADTAATNLTARFPGLTIAGTRNGYFTPAEEPGIVDGIRAARPDLLFVAFGIPKQEKWIDANLPATGAKLAMGVGGSFDAFAGVVKRAPLFVRRLHMEWLWRTLSNPKKIGKAMTLPKFAWMVISAKR
ncbi:MAG TPA: WecB/TagA/CpsF family glycosyltransferase [Armatimonadota bacterium]|jgi:N-acetylglucosaminyldiphosphoundecaprenol N-acetyl-beta-D-mannosaminyltransferase